MQVANHLLVGEQVSFKRSPNVGGIMAPTGVIMHYTAGFTTDSAIATLTNPAAKVSAHLVIDRDGSITQLVPFNRVAWHAGPSTLDGISGCNNFCVGFEFVNPGWLHLPATGHGYTDSANRPLSDEQVKDLCGPDMIVAPNARIGGGTFGWPAYTPAQIAAGLAAFAAVCAAYKITHIAGHEEIDLRKWKTDPGINFPMGRFKQQLHGGNDRSDGGVRAATAVTSTKVNVRAAPTSTAQVMVTLEKNSEVAVIAPDNGGFTKVQYAAGRTGYVSSLFLKDVPTLHRLDSYRG